MVKAKGTIGGKQVVILGLSFGNLDRFKAEPGDTFIRIRGEEIGIPHDILVISGETEKDIAEMLSAGFDEDTKVHLT